MPSADKFMSLMGSDHQSIQLRLTDRLHDEEPGNPRIGLKWLFDNHGPAVQGRSEQLRSGAAEYAQRISGGLEE